MTKAAPLLELAKRPFVILCVTAFVLVVLVWLLAFFEPQTHKLDALDSQKASLQQTVLLDQARLQRVRQESHHVGQIQAVDARLKGYVPSSEDLYTFIQTLSSAGKSTGVTISSLQPGAATGASGTTYSAIPISADVKAPYDNLVAFIKAIYNLPRLTDVNSVTITGGGPGTNRSTPLSATFDLVIFTSQKAGSAS